MKLYVEVYDTVSVSTLPNKQINNGVVKRGISHRFFFYNFPVKVS